MGYQRGSFRQQVSRGSKSDRSQDRAVWTFPEVSSRRGYQGKIFPPLTPDLFLPRLDSTVVGPLMKESGEKYKFENVTLLPKCTSSFFIMSLYGIWEMEVTLCGIKTFTPVLPLPHTYTLSYPLLS